MLKLVVFVACVAVASADVSHLFRKPAVQVLTPYQRTYTPVVPRTVYPVQYKPSGPVVGILNQHQDANPDGSYAYGFNAENGISVQEQGSVRSFGKSLASNVEGSYSYISPEGETVQLRYVADENGFHPEGSHIPVAPPVPLAIQRALAYIAAHPQQEETKTYNTNKYYSRF